jgi:hypothetical protein
MIYFNMGHNDMDYETKPSRELSSTFANKVQNRLILNALEWLGTGDKTANPALPRRVRPARPAAAGRSPGAPFEGSISLGMAWELGRAGCADDPGLRVDRDAGPVADERVTLVRR